MIPSPVPHGRTARRLEWKFLPPHVRALVEARCGSPVVAAESQGAGFTPGFASVLECADGSRHFVKAASVKAQRVIAQSYREEGRRLAALPASAPAPQLRWQHVDDDWVVLGIEHVPAALPARPWSEQDLGAMLDALEVVADELTPAPAAMRLDGLDADLADWPAYWEQLRGFHPDLPGLAEHLPEAAALAARAPAVSAGSTAVHTDVRDDNVLLVLGDDGVRRALLCDWNWPALGAAWFDTVLALVGPRGDGLEVDKLLMERRLTRDVPADDVDAVLALVSGYFLLHCQHPVPPTSPHLRASQAWQGEVVWDWLCERRGWT